jgi:hypothetical protein
MLYLAIIVLGFFLSACSPVQRIADATNRIRLEAQVVKMRGLEIGDQEVVLGADKIIALASGIHVDLGGVEDKTPAWMSMLTWIALAAVLVAVAVILWQTGIGTFIRVAIGWIPRRKIAAASLAVDMLDPASPEGDREYIAAQRAQDPLFDAAYRRAKKKKEATS